MQCIILQNIYYIKNKRVENMYVTFFIKKKPIQNMRYRNMKIVYFYGNNIDKR